LSKFEKPVNDKIKELKKLETAIEMLDAERRMIMALSEDSQEQNDVIKQVEQFNLDVDS
jgi:hypothetical protein